MSSTDWIQELKVVELKEELKKRDQPIAGKKAELAARLEEYVKEHEAGAAEGAAVEAETAAEKEDLAAEEASVPAQEEAALEKEGEAAEEPALKAGPGGEAEAAVAPAEAKALAADDFNLDYGESDDEQPQKQEAKPAEKPAERPAAAAQPSSKPERKDQEEEMKEPESRKRPTSEIPPSEEASRPEKQAKTEQYLSKPKQPAGADAPAVAIAAEKPEQQQERKPGSRALLIEGFVRPFTENQARTLLGQSGTVVAMWMPSIRNLAWVVYSTISEAQAAKTALFKLQWPAGSPKVLMPRSVSIRAAEKAIGHGKGDENFKIDRSEEDGPDEPEIENTRSKAMDIEGAITIPAGHPSTSHQQQQHATADDEEILKDASPLRVKDLRELLSRKSTGSARAAERKRRDPGPNLDELFRKTIAKPSIYWLPLSEEAVELKKKAKAATGSAGGNGSGRSLAAWYARPASAARVSIQLFSGSCLTSKARKPATIPPKKEMGSATAAATIPSNPSLEGFLSLAVPLEAAQIHLLGMRLFAPRLGWLGREDRDKDEVNDKDIFKTVGWIWKQVMLPQGPSG